MLLGEGDQDEAEADRDATLSEDRRGLGDSAFII